MELWHVLVLKYYLYTENTYSLRYFSTNQRGLSGKVNQ